MQRPVTGGLVGRSTPAVGDEESIRAFAARVGRTHPTISEHIERGNITAVVRDEKGRLKGVYWRQALAEYVRNVDPTAAEKTGKVPVSQNNAASAERVTQHAAMQDQQAHRELAGQPNTSSTRGGAEADAAAASAQGSTATSEGGGSANAPAGWLELPSSKEDDEDGYLQHRARTEKFRSMQAELDYLQALGLLVPVGQFREATFRRYRMLRDKLLNIPDRVATVLAAERDPTQVHQKLTEELKRVLSELSDDARAEAARGAAERVAA